MQFILVAPLLFTITFGTIEFGEYFYVKHCYETAAESAAMVAICSGSTYTQVQNAVTNSLTAAHLNNSGYTLTVEDNGTTIASLSAVNAGDTITVSLTATWGNAGHGFSPMRLISSSKNVLGAATMRAEAAGATGTNYSYTVADGATTAGTAPSQSSWQWSSWGTWWYNNH